MSESPPKRGESPVKKQRKLTDMFMLTTNLRQTQSESCSGLQDKSGVSDDHVDTVVTPDTAKCSLSKPGNELDIKLAVVAEFDIGEVDFSKTLSDSQKFQILTNKFAPDKKWKGPQRVIGKNKRRVPSSIFEESRSAFAYSVKKDAVFCAPCCVFAATDELFVRQCHNDWSNIEKHVQRHLKCKTHLSAVEASLEFLKVCNNKQESVQSQLSKAYNDKIRQNRSALAAIVKTIAVCGRQNIPLRGHTDDRSNFIALLQYRSECDDNLRTHLASCPGNAKYISHDIQNELIQLCGEQIVSKHFYLVTVSK
jgi:hypothetical protein